ncbi:peptidase M14 [Aureimonas jatrophae]|nr:peptidase M14 [Aureimonas jatrophae]
MRFERTLDRLLQDARPGERFEAWTFDDRASRVRAERALAERGIEARIRSAYKPLVHALREEIDLAGVERIELHYPVHADAPPNRFRLEAYPLAALVGNRPLDMAPHAAGDLVYRLRLHRADGIEVREVFAPNRVHRDEAGTRLLSPTGWLRRAGEPDGRRLATDYEAVFDEALRLVANHAFGAGEPFFEELHVGMTLPAADEPLGFAEEASSLREALHEDLYFSLLAHFGRRSGHAAGERRLRPGQIVPEVAMGPEARLRVALRSFQPTRPAPAHEEIVETAREPLSPQAVARALERIGGERFLAQSRAGRPVEARYHRGTDAAVVISGGQHANETTGTVGALRAALRLATRPGAHFTVSPLENPDGTEIHRRLRAQDPAHMHHAARYTGFGDDLEHRELADGEGEEAVRRMAVAASGACLHLNLHGYPAHEWTRPLSGYVPAGFAQWTLPKGFFLIARHHPGWEPQTEELLDRVTRHLAAMPALLAENQRQIALYERHAGETGFTYRNGWPCFVSADSRAAVPVTLVTEYPDETIGGEAFAAGHAAQMEAVLAAYEAWQAIMALG